MNTEKIWNRKFILLFVTNLLMMATFYAAVPILPIYCQQIGITGSKIGIVLTSMSITTVLFRPFAGYILDNFNRYRVYMLFLTLFSLPFLGFAAFPIFAVLVILRLYMGVPERNLELVDEKNSTIWTTLAQTTVPAVPYNSDAWFVPTGRQLFEVQSQIMREAVKNRSCVIIGRCSPHIFAGYEKHTSIFLQAHMDSRIARLEKTLGKTVDREVIEKKDKERARYYRTYTGKRWLDLSEYDFMLDTTSFDDQQLTEILLRYIYCRFPELKNKNLL